MIELEIRKVARREHGCSPFVVFALRRGVRLLALRGAQRSDRVLAREFRQGLPSFVFALRRGERVLALRGAIRVPEFQAPSFAQLRLVRRHVVDLRVADDATF